MYICFLGLVAMALVAGDLLIFAAVPPNSQSNATVNTRVEQLWRAAQEAQGARDYSKAIELYKKILVLQPDLIGAEVNLGLMYQVQGDLQSAMDTFKQALKRSPDLYPPNLLIGLDYLKQAKPDVALPYLDKAVTLQPADAKAQVGFANSNLQLHHYQVAQEHFQHAIELDRSNADAWYGLGATYLSMEKESEFLFVHATNGYRIVLLAESELQQGRPAQAIKLLVSAAAAVSEVPCSHSLLGFAYLAAGSKDEAAKQFASDWNDQSKTGCLEGKLGMAAISAQNREDAKALGQLADAEGIDAKAVRADSDLFLSYFRRAELETRARESIESSAQVPSLNTPEASADVLLKSGRYTACTRALSGRPTERSLQQNRLLAQCAFYAGQDDVVLEATDAMLEAAPGEPAALFWRIRSLGRLGLMSLAMATEINPESVSLHMMFANVLRAQQKFSEAAQEYRKAIALNAEFLPAHVGLAQDLFFDSKPDGAESELDKVLKADPNDAQANYLMGEILLRRGDAGRALPLLIKGLKIAPEQRPDVHAALSKAYDEQGETARAIAELQLALGGDEDGSYHYRLARLFDKVGNHAAAVRALAESRRLRAQSDSFGLNQSQ